MKVYRYVCMTAAILMLFLSSKAVNAATPRLTFTNTRAENISLYITKEVTCKDPQMTAPTEDSFLFYLKLNQTAAKEREYHLFRNGQELFNYGGILTAVKQEGQLPTAFVTDQNGGFSLRGGETACFEDLTSGTSYEISESPTEDYLQTEPRGGTAAIGTITAEGASVTFHNLYVVSPPKESESTILEIRKDIVFPYGYELPQTPEFAFHVQIKGVSWSNKPFTILDEKSERVLFSGFTDDSGCFAMKGGCFARFEEVPADADYEVTEESVSGWRKIAESNTRGATVTPVTTISFTNTETSFVVTKQMSDSSTVKIPFLFKLRKDGKPWADAEYYLYKKSGIQIDAEKHTTNAEGKFFLFPEQAAVFTGADAGTVYSVTELVQSGYTLTVPVGSPGYLNKIVSDSVEVLPFVNHYEFSLPITGGKGVMFHLVSGITGIAILLFLFSKKRGTC